MSVEFDNIINFRDVGKTVNDFLGRKLVLHINTPLETPLMKKTGSSGKVCSIAQHDLVCESDHKLSNTICRVSRHFSAPVKDDSKKPSIGISEGGTADAKARRRCDGKRPAATHR
jgi:hypothetical protein